MLLTTEYLKEFDYEHFNNAILDAFDTIFERIRWLTAWLNAILDAFDWQRNFFKISVTNILTMQF